MGRKQQFAVEKEGVEDFVLEKYKEQEPSTRISELLLNEKKVKISPLSINRWLKKQRETDVNETSVISKEKFDVMVMDYTSELKSILAEVKEMKAIAVAEGKLDIYVKLVGKIYDGISLFAKINGDISQKNNAGSVDINIIINKINKEAFGQNKNLRDNLHTLKTIDVDAEVLEEDFEEEMKLKGKQ